MKGKVGRTQHRAPFILDAPLLSNVVCNPEEDGHVVFGGILLSVESPDDGKTPALVDIK
jgi:hypothetical protein